ESARSALDTASAHIEADPTRAASALDTAQRALTMANAQTDAIFSAKTDLDAIRDRLGAAIGALSGDIVEV
ncbi:TPM domain-containing protein, partial [Vibrio cholerae]|nr:TPM domain-containing protein [Vibrio cholerae]